MNARVESKPQTKLSIQNNMKLDLIIDNDEDDDDKAQKSFEQDDPEDDLEFEQMQQYI